MREVWSFVEYQGERIARSCQESLSEAVRQARRLDARCTALIPGYRIPPRVIEEVGRFGVDRALVCDEEPLGAYSTARYADWLERMLLAHAPGLLLMGGSAVARDLAPRVSARLRCGLVTDATFLLPQDDGFHVTRSVFRPHASMILSFHDKGPAIVTLAPKVMEVERAGPGERFVVESPDRAEVPRSRCRDEVTIEKAVREIPARMDLADAEVIVSGGKGMQTAENFRLLEELAEVLGGTVAATRMAVDLGWRPRECMVGVTGRTVSPDLYVACGISGAIQHVMGMQSSETVIAINTDPHAPIFRAATLGIVGDVREVLPVLIDCFRNAAAEAGRSERTA